MGHSKKVLTVLPNFVSTNQKGLFYLDNDSYVHCFSFVDTFGSFNDYDRGLNQIDTKRLCIDDYNRTKFSELYNIRN